MPYKIIFLTSAERDFGSLPKELQRRMLSKLESISKNPFPYVKRLAGSPLFSLRVGDYRILMNIEKGTMTILVVKIGHRRNVYEK